MLSAFGLGLLFGAPWLVGIAWVWSRVRQWDDVPASMAESAMRRLWT